MVPAYECYADGSVGARVRMMCRGGCLPVRGARRVQWRKESPECSCGMVETRDHLFLECERLKGMRDEWQASVDQGSDWEGLILGLTGTQADQDRTQKYIGEVWIRRRETERGRAEAERTVVVAGSVLDTDLALMVAHA